MFEILGEIIDEGNDVIGIGHSQISAGTKIILYVNDKKHFGFTGLHGNLIGPGTRRIP
jgi:hypothetical protein